MATRRGLQPPALASLALAAQLPPLVGISGRPLGAGRAFAVHARRAISVAEEEGALNSDYLTWPVLHYAWHTALLSWPHVEEEHHLQCKTSFSASPVRPRVSHTDPEQCSLPAHHMALLYHHSPFLAPSISHEMHALATRKSVGSPNLRRVGWGEFQAFRGPDSDQIHRW